MTNKNIRIVFYIYIWNVRVHEQKYMTRSHYKKISSLYFFAVFILNTVSVHVGSQGILRRLVCVLSRIFIILKHCWYTKASVELWLKLLSQLWFYVITEKTCTSLRTFTFKCTYLNTVSFESSLDLDVCKARQSYLGDEIVTYGLCISSRTSLAYCNILWISSALRPKARATVWLLGLWVRIPFRK